MTAVWIIAIVLGIVEGMTEFLPVSSTGHLILAGHVLGFTGEFANTFEIAVQLGAILAVVVYFRHKLLDLARNVWTDRGARLFVAALVVGFLPAGVVGALAHGAIKTYLFSPVAVAIALIVGGFAILAIEALGPRGRIDRLEAIDLRTAFWIGVAQCTALFPGISRAGATIMGGLLTGLDRHTAAEFSFLLALPTLTAAALYDGYKNRALFGQDNLIVLGIGLVAAFGAALLVISLFLAFVKRFSFRPFAYYRIALGLLVLALI
jgi:undecaprenyl-diphosphatase